MNFPHLKNYPDIAQEAVWLGDQITRIRNETHADRGKPFAFEEFAPRCPARSRAARILSYQRDGEDMHEDVLSIALQYVYPLQEIREAYDANMPLASSKATWCARSMRRKIDSVVIRDPLPGKTCLVDVANVGRSRGITGMVRETEALVNALRVHGRTWTADELEVVVLEEFEQFSPTWERIDGRDAAGGPPYGLVTYCHARLVGPVIYKASAWR